MMPSRILLTGVPGVGKTTVIRKVARFIGPNAAGFYTEETREGGRRTVSFNRWLGREI